ncbi:protein arginine kinase [Anaerotalea alkaliphila]|uniref:Protein-arginine kinase n=1 Tax=Anaerotalea alkaliphila TaxID=2662126 RepID=A0A7X5KP03_9FIRM|nr:protein arginine kinase [Anaerotalea alkaliphila]NDL67307.1 protein arginine kinase [Anaerotalea alkaliphila]
MKWYEEIKNTDGQGVVVSSRVRLARNLARYNFPSHCSEGDARGVIQEIAKVVEESQDLTGKLLRMEEVRQLDKVVMMEKHLISPLFINSHLPGALYVTEDEDLSIMVNEEDHLRIQSMMAGDHLQKALEKADALDSILEEHLMYAFNSQLGYLTSCPTNVGTGMRASYMVHVPALESTGQFQYILEAIGKFGLTVRGIYGESSDALGSMFQISNQVTLGISEQEILDNLSAVTRQIVKQELVVREQLLKEKYSELEDAVFRSYGLMRYARVLTAKEAMTLLSDLKLGIELGVLKTKQAMTMNIYTLMMSIQPASLQKMESRSMSVQERDMARAEYIRKNLPEIIGG